jgi:ABC-type nitrate/sulfonate/bicarbonate transport system permease component
MHLFPWKGRVWNLATIIVFIVVWQAVASFRLLDTRIMPAPFAILREAVAMLCDSSLLVHWASSFQRVLTGYAIACLCGLSIAICAVMFPAFRLLRSALEVLHPIPPIAWIPLAILWFGLGDHAAYFIVFIGAVFPIMIGSYFALSNVNLTVVHAAQCLGAGRRQLLFDVLMPAALPAIFVSLRVALGTAWMSVIAAEMVGTQNGLGYLIQVNRIMLEPERVLVGMIAIGFTGWSMSTIASAIERRVTPWHQATVITPENARW